MGYYPPFIPDTYLQTFRYIPSSRMAIKKVEAVQYKYIDQKTWAKQLKQPDEIKKITGLGFYFDQYA